MIIKRLAITTGGTFEGGEDRHGRENGRKRSIGGPEGPPVAQFGAKTWQQWDLPGIKAQQEATEGTQRGGRCALTGPGEVVKARQEATGVTQMRVGVL